MDLGLSVSGLFSASLLASTEFAFYSGTILGVHRRCFLSSPQDLCFTPRHPHFTAEDSRRVSPGASGACEPCSGASPARSFVSG